jgi:CO dehydrogenase/acetyl-CoA synthase beta subunit
VTGPVSGANDENEDEEEEEEEEEKRAKKRRKKKSRCGLPLRPGRILSGISGAIYVSFYCHA